MTKEEVELVAELLTKIGGTWYPERAQSEARPVGQRHREVARLIVEAVERSKVTDRVSLDDDLPSGSLAETVSVLVDGVQLQVGATVEYRFPGDKRTITCRIERMEGERAYLVPERREIGWVSTHTRLPLKRLRNKSQPPRPPQPGRTEDVVAFDQAAVDNANVEPLLKPAEPMKLNSRWVGEVPAGMQHYFASSGDWIAFRRTPNDRYLFDQKGNWIGWFPWDDDDAVDLNGQYLGTVVDNHLYRRTFPETEKREVGYVLPPDRVGFSGYPGYATPCVPPFGFKDIDLRQIRTGRRPWLKASGPSGASSGNRTPFHALMSTLGLGRAVTWIERIIQLRKGS
ncbi:hypothetical protein AB4072_06075 [Microvirga sp. 2MCAF38]|uniref:hypothetical protein n=1 Tax=Microvirga sp. 2MCAF38 TaxID=3232989 RepID=UPI003F9A2073